MSLDSYSNLKTEIADWLERPDLTTQIDTFIDLAEEHHRHNLRVREMIKRSTAAASTSSKYLALPAGYLYMRNLRLLTTPISRLQFVNEDELVRLTTSATGKPKWFTVHEEIEFDRVPDSDYSVQMIYYAKPTALSAQNETNAILTNYPSLYLYGALVAAEPFIDNDERIPTWQGLYQEFLNKANKSDRLSRHVGPLVERPIIGSRP